MSKLIFIFLWLSLPGLLSAQEFIDTDRPDQTESACLVPKHYFQAETGFSRERLNGLTAIIHPSALWKYGIHKRVELRLLTELRTEETPHFMAGRKNFIAGIVPVEIGSKISLVEEKGIIPKTSLIVHTGIPALSSVKFRTNRLSPGFRFTMAHTLAQHLCLGYNLGAEWDGTAKTPYWIYTLTTGFSFHPRWYMYIELFGTANQESYPQHHVDGGIAFLVSNDIKVDLSAGKSIPKPFQYNYAALGFSFRVNTKPAE